MNIKATEQEIRKHAKALLGNNFSPEAEEALVLACATVPDARPGYHISHQEAEHLEAIDTILGNFGVEGFVEGDLDVQYSNTGDTYAMTVMYVNGELCLGDWGSVIEDNE